MKVRTRKPGGGRKRKADAVRRAARSNFRMPDPVHHALNIYLSERGESLNSYLLRLVREDLERQGRRVLDPPSP